MKRWGLVWLVAMLSCIPILLSRASNPSLLQDSDTSFLLKIIRERQDPLYWFTHDWPLMNHFYRPISTLTFEFDNALYRNQAWGFGLTNALLCCVCILLLAWLMRELTDSIPISAFCVALFGLWHSNVLDAVLPWLTYFAIAVGFFGFFRHGFKLGLWVPSVLALAYFGHELAGVVPLGYRLVAWLPGRTASVMTIFCLVAMAAYARYERLSANREEPVSTSTDEPAGTRGSIVALSSGQFSAVWIVVSLVAIALALGSYEQAIMLPAVLFGVAVSMRLQRFRVRWGWQFAFWGMLVLYLFARRAFLPEGVSAYQAQQFRSGGWGIFLFVADYLFPSLGAIVAQFKVFDLGWSILLTSHLYEALWRLAANLYGFAAASRHWTLGLTGLALSILAYLPMAWLHQFEHYHYWPMALRTLFVAVLGWGTWELCVIALSPQARQAPQRLAPAPGSLPHL